MKAKEISLLKQDGQSFTFFHETKPFTRWHYHLEYELVFINKGSGKRMVGDHIDRFENHDLVLLGPNLPHEWLCEPYYFSKEEGFKGDAIVIQFLEHFLGDSFFKLPENKKLFRTLEDAKRGCIFYGETKRQIIALLLQMKSLNKEDRFYELFKLFKILANTFEYKLLSSPNFTSDFNADDSSSLKKVIAFIMQNFNKKISMKQMLEISNMSSTTFSVVFKKNFNMTFSEYVLKVRVGYACSLLTDDKLSISQISHDSGFENLSNFNRIFKKIKGITPKEFRKKANLSEHFEEFYQEA